MNATESAIARHPSGKELAEVEASDIPDVLTAADRCDRCSAGALYLLQHLRKTELELALCHHHGKRLAPLMDTDWTIVGQNLSLMRELYASNRLKGDDHS